MKRILPLLTNLALTAGSLLLVFLAFELVLRLAGPSDGGGKEQQTRFIYTEPDPILGWRKTPGTRTVYDRREYRVEVAINRRGLRDRERDYPRNPDVFRVLALGDSFIEGFMVPLDQTVPRQLETLLNTKGCRADVINGGTSGYSTDQEFLFFESEGYKYAPQVVILFFYYNDVFFNQAAGYAKIPKPRLEFDGDRWRIANLPLPLVQVRSKAPASPPETRGSVAWSFITDHLESTAPHFYNRLARLGLWEPIRQVVPSAELAVFRKHPDREVELAWDQTHRILRALARRVADKGARFLVVYVPSRMEVHDASWESTKVRYGWGERGWDRNVVLSRLREIASIERIPLLDLTPALRRANRWLRPTYYTYDRHWNARGQRVAAVETEAFLRRLTWLPACAY